jgi:hypothetical protein
MPRVRVSSTLAVVWAAAQPSRADFRRNQATMGLDLFSKFSNLIQILQTSKICT